MPQISTYGIAKCSVLVYWNHWKQWRASSDMFIGDNREGFTGRCTCATCATVITMSADKRIRVSEERREQLHDLKGVGESYDEVLKQLIQEHNRKQLAEKMRKVDDMDHDEFVPLSDDE